MKNLQILSKKFSNIDSLHKLKDYIGKKAFSSTGEYIGKVKDIYSQNNILEGLLIIGKLSLFVDKEYINSATGEAVMLSIDPVTSIVGKQVFDADGRSLGKVIALDRKSNANNYTAIIVKKGLFRKNRIIPKEEIEVNKYNIILNKVYQ